MNHFYCMKAGMNRYALPAPTSCRYLLLLCYLLAGFFPDVVAQQAHNPILFADVPDMSIIRVKDTYYMSSTTMHMSPGCRS